MTARVLVPTGYAARFNMPGGDGCTTVPVDFIGRQRRLWQPLEAVAVWRPRRGYDVIHTFNRVPLTRKPWLVTFESLLPRTIGPRQEWMRSLLRRRLLQPNLHRVLAMSDFARVQFAHQSRDWPDASRVLSKMQVVAPSTPVRTGAPRSYRAGEELRLVFVGLDWGRKGGVVVARLAELLDRGEVPARIDVVSSLRFSYTDDARHELYDDDRRRLVSSARVTCHDRLPNDRVQELLAQAHVLLLPTISDTFGYSVLEGLAHSLPAIVSNVCALPELVTDGENGFVLDVPIDERRRWVHEGRRSWPMLDEAWTALAEQAAGAVERIVGGDVDYGAMSTAALGRIRTRHDPAAMRATLGGLYRDAANGADRTAR